MNTEPVGMELGLQFGGGRDIFCGGKCDEIVLELVKKLGWEERARAVSKLLPEGSKTALEASL